MKHRIVTAAQMKEIERAGNAHGLPYLQMMENAGLAAYTQLRARLPLGGALLIVCGKGNNGGDGLVMARAAAQDGWRVVVLLAEGDPKTPDAMTNYARLADLPVTKCRDAAALAAQPFDAVVDALYGTGFHGSLRPAGLAACALMNRQRESGAFVLAVDLPSGINTDTGEAAEGAVRADLTVTFDSCKLRTLLRGDRLCRHRHPGRMAPGRSCTALSAKFCPYKKALSLIFALQIRESAFVLLTRGGL